MTQQAGARHDRYSAVAIALHWAIALLIVFNLGVGFFMEGLRPALKGVVVPLHISSGITVLALSVARVAWRLSHRPPPLSDTLKPWERTTAHSVHTLLYVMMIVMPLIGWSIISAHPPHPGHGPAVWGVLPLPPIAPISHLERAFQHTMHGYFVEAHTIGGLLLLGLLALHVGGAMKHQFHDRQPELARMGIGAG